VRYDEHFLADAAREVSATGVWPGIPRAESWRYEIIRVLPIGALAPSNLKAQRRHMRTKLSVFEMKDII
jgi:hypothetical protein